ncbi:MAG TPA: DNA topoisomerase (ATP-hydrolyzing) [Euzebyales bacterium]|nr:DNA topoisomerase (ATP-hydrolyzing) [Euzebyales bacterium]
MSRQPSLLDTPDGARGVRAVNIVDRMQQAFLDYSMSVIVGRALPDVRDGLKPVQRRILYAMWEAGLRPDRPLRKCARAVGEVMQKYHPHGDTSIYDALVRMAQDFTMRAPLIDGHGNFGSIDGDNAAAMRYTEARLSEIAMALLDGINEQTVDFVPNYDGDDEEPVVLPARLPNLLLNGSSGIAVGMATNIPPHNLGELIDACLLLIGRPEATLDDLLDKVPAPDFPTGGRIVSTDGIRQAYATGRGAVTVEAIATTETRSGGMPRIIVTEIPYQVNKATLLERIADLVKSRRIEEIRDLRDESSRDGMRIVIELKRGENPARVLGKLYRHSDLRTNFNVNIVALHDGQPRTLGLRDCLVAYVAHQRQVLTRRTTYRRDRAAARAHVLQGLMVALDHLDEVIALIRAAASADVARAQLMERYGLTEIQATAILDMQLRRLAQLEREKIANELAELGALIAELEAILNDPAKLDRLLVTELRELRRAHADPRRSRLDDRVPTTDDAADDAADVLPQLEAQPVTVYVTAGAVIKAVNQRRTSTPYRDRKDPVVAVLRATTADDLLLVDAEGGGYRVALADVPVVPTGQRGVPIAQLYGSPPDAPIIGAVHLVDGTDVVTLSAQGLIKRSSVDEYRGRTQQMIAAGVRDDDELVDVTACTDDDQLLVAHSGGLAIRFGADEVRTMGRPSFGVAAQQIPEGQRCVGVSVMSPVDMASEVVTIDADGAGKRSPLDDYPMQKRGGKGVLSGADHLAWLGAAADLHVTTSDGPQVVRAVQLDQAGRSRRPVAAVPDLTGRVVPERRGDDGAR